MARTVMFASCVAACLVVGTTLCYAQRAHSPLSQPFRDLGLVRDHVPDVLQHAVDAPYGMPQGGEISTNADCAAITTEIAALDSELGPDVDYPSEHHLTAGSLFAGAVRSALKLPYGSIIRHITGASHREQVMQDAVRAGMVRRAFLKGLRVAHCTFPAPTPLPPMTTLVDDMPQALPPDVMQARAETPASPPSSAPVSAAMTQVAAIETPPQGPMPLVQSVASVTADTGAPPPASSKAQ